MRTGIKIAAASFVLLGLAAMTAPRSSAELDFAGCTCLTPADKAQLGSHFP